MTIHPANTIAFMPVMGKWKNCTRACVFNRTETNYFQSVSNVVLVRWCCSTSKRNGSKTFSPCILLFFFALALLFVVVLNNYVVCVYTYVSCSYIRSRHLSRFIRSVSYNDCDSTLEIYTAAVDLSSFDWWKKKSMKDEILIFHLGK